MRGGNSFTRYKAFSPYIDFCTHTKLFHIIQSSFMLYKASFSTRVTSPSIRYCALPQYANKVIHTCTDGEKLDVQVAFKVRLKPTTYAIGQETVRATEQGKHIDPNFSNDEIEWYTKDDERGSIVLTGFLLKCTEMRTVSEGLKHLHHPRHLRGLSRASQFSTRRSGVWALLATTKAFQSERARGHRIAGACHPAHPS